MEKQTQLIILYDFYKNLFSIQNQNYFEDYYFNNLSLAEISENEKLSRNAIHKHLKSMEQKLLEYEEALKLCEKSIKLEKIVSKISDKQIKNELLKLDES